jgi:hypothetical protein
VVPVDFKIYQLALIVEDIVPDRSIVGVLGREGLAMTYESNPMG